MSISIFISYSNEDSGKMRSLQRQIKAHRDLEAIVVADDRKASKLLSDKVKEGIEECDYFVCILTSKSISNQWVNQEIGYATALGKSILPVIDAGILDELKGFVHKQMDLPYSVCVKGKSIKSQSTLFSRRFKVLIGDILRDNHIEVQEVGLERLFPGVWQRERFVRGKAVINPRIEIKNGNQYFSNQAFNFFLTDFIFDSKNQHFVFKKQNPKTGAEALNDLKIIKLYHHYEGSENGRPVKYIRV